MHFIKNSTLTDRDMVFIALFAALIIALGFIPQLLLPFGVPITAQSLGVMLCGLVLGAKRGTLAVLLFLTLMFIGLPILSGGRGGVGLLATGSGGFLIGWPFAAYVTGLLFEKITKPSAFISGTIASIIGGILVLYAFGVLGLMINLGMTLGAAITGSLGFVPGDVIKAVIAGFITAKLLIARPQSVLSRA